MNSYKAGAVWASLAMAVFTAALMVLSMDVRAEAAVAPPACSMAELRKAVRERPRLPDQQRRRAAALAAALSCPNHPDYPTVAAAAAYELSLLHAGATGLPADLPRAIAYARQSAALLQATDDQQLWFKTRLALARLTMHAASDLVALAATRTELEAIAPQLQGAPWAQAVDADYYQLLGELNEQMVQHGDASARAAALDAIECYLATGKGRAATSERAAALETKARLLLPSERGAGSARGADFEQARAASEQAGALYRALGSRQDRLRVQVNLALAYLRMDDTRYADNVDSAIAILDPVLKQIDARRQPELYVEAANNLGSAFMARQHGERNQNMLHAVRWYRAARKQLDPSDPDQQARWVRTSVNLAMALEAIQVSEEQHRQEADGILSDTIAWLEQRKHFEQTVKPLALQATIRLTWAGWGHPDQLDAAGALLAKALERSSRLPPERRASLQADYADYHLQRFAAGEPQALDQAIAAYRAALALVDRQASPSIWASMQNNLGNACNTRTRPDLYRCAAEAYQQALLVRTDTALPREHADTLVNLANLEFEHANWAQAAALYSTVARRHRAMFAAIEQDAVLLASARQSKRWFERAAYALAKQGRNEEGLWIAEHGKTRVLKRRLGLGQEGEDGGQMAGLDDLDAAPGSLILAPIVSTKGALVFALARTRERWLVRSVFLDSLDADAVVTFIQGGKRIGPEKAGWLGAYQASVRQRGAGPAQQAWNDKLGDTAAWLGERLVRPVFAVLEAEGVTPRSVTWVTQGELAVLPIHTALMRDGRTLLEHMPVSYAPSLHLLRDRPQGRAARAGKPLRLVSVGNPGNDPDLLLAGVEAHSAYARLPPATARLLSGEHATAARVKQALQRSSVFHFAGHASFLPADPRQSHLLLANGQRLTVGALQASVGATGPDLVILSACESGLIDIFDIANEFQGLPAAFLGLGSRGVVSSLWPVDDGPTLFLVDRLMEATLLRKRSVPEALREAQLWLKQARAEELAPVAQRLGGLSRHPATKARLAKLAWLFEHKPGWRPYAEPAQWAGFIYSGSDLHDIGKQ